VYGLNFDSRFASHCTFPNPCNGLAKWRALPSKTAKPQSETNELARFHARGAKNSTQENAICAGDKNREGNIRAEA
jgi:hypothetical protein